MVIEMPKLLLGLAILPFFSQSRPTAFYVEQTYVLADRYATYILHYSNTIIPPDKLAHQSDIDCLVGELKATGIFTKIRTRLVQTGAETQRLTITVSERNVRKLILAAIVLKRLPEIDAGVFQAKLRSQGIAPGMPLTKYHYGALAERVNHAVLDSLPKSMLKDDMGLAWLTFRPVGKRRVKLIVSPEYSGCE
jgi:hypothetical protein